LVKHLNVIAAATLLSLVGAAHAAGDLSAANLRLPPASAIGMDPLTGNTSDPSNWRFAPGQNIGGVAGLLDGVARLSFTTSAGNYACSGSLLAGGQYVLTAAHCADDFSKMTVQFGWYDGKAVETRNVSVGNAFIHAGWNGDLDTGADIAILKLDAPVTTIKGYNLSTTNDVGKTHLTAGYGTTSNGGSNTATNWNDGKFGHYAFNTFDIDSKTFNKVVGDAIGPDWGYDESYYKHGVTYMVDFDKGTAQHNTMQRIADMTGNKFSSNEGLGGMEGLIAGGDSGGGDFVWNGTEWVLSGVHSWGWQACSTFGLDCDVSTINRSSYGDLSGSTAVFSHLDFIASVTAVPEPETYALMALGLWVVAGAARRRNKA
jgi:hypothetical protein